MRTCTTCKIEKDENEFSFSNKKDNILHYKCKNCAIKYAAKYRKEHKKQIKEKGKEYYEENKEKILEQKSEYYKENKDTILEKDKKYRTEHKEEIAIYNIGYYQEHKKERFLYQKERYQNDVSYKLRQLISKSIRNGLKANSSSKKGKSIIQFFTYSFDELKFHIEQQFEHWMTWENWGIYDPKTWNDNDSLTWKWQLDHIIPHSEFHYETMDCQEFKDCWALNNLRPLNAKQNIIDGLTKVRHYKPTDLVNKEIIYNKEQKEEEKNGNN